MIANASTNEDAFAVVRSAAATDDERIGAAIALRVAGEPERVRIAADTLANDDVRDALEAIADGADDVRVERALRKIR